MTGEIAQFETLPIEAYSYRPYEEPEGPPAKERERGPAFAARTGDTVPDWEEVLRSGAKGRTGRMAPLWERWKDCRSCRLHSGRTQVVLGAGNPDTPTFVLVGEGPGATEDQEGTPFVGRTGRELTLVLNQVGIDRVRECYLMNAVCCWPPGNRNPERDEVLACRPRLREQILGLLAAGTVKAIVLVGKPAYAALMHGRDLEREEFRIDSIRISDHLGWVDPRFLPAGWPRVYTVYHPSYIVRQGPQSRDRHLWEQDWEAIRYWGKEGILIDPRRVA